MRVQTNPRGMLKKMQTLTPAYLNDTMGDGLKLMGKKTHKIIHLNKRPYILHQEPCGCTRSQKVEATPALRKWGVV